MKRKVISVLIAAGMMISLFSGCGSKDSAADAPAETKKESQEEAKDEKTTFTVGFDAEYPPYGYMDENGEYTGFDLELAEAVCELQRRRARKKRRVKRPLLPWDSMQNIRRMDIWMRTENIPDLIWNWQKRYVNWKVGNW